MPLCSAFCSAHGGAFPYLAASLSLGPSHSAAPGPPAGRKWVRCTAALPVAWPPGRHLAGGELLAGLSDGLPFGPYVPLALAGWLSAWYQSPNRVSGGELTGGGDQLF